MWRSPSLLACIVPVLALAGCAVGPDYVRPATETPAAYRFPDAGATTVLNGDWWSQFKDPVLETLISTAIAQNKDLAIAAARIDEYHGRYVTTRAGLFPSVGAELTGGRQRTPATPLVPAVEGQQVQADAFASWEIDLFGRQRRLTESARADFFSTEYARDATLISLQANVATAYFTLRDLDQRLRIAHATADTRKAAMDLFHERFQGGVVSQVQVAQAESEYALAVASVSAFEQQIAQQENSLSLLLGENPGAIPRGRAIDQIALPAIPAGLPSSLLDQRPDIRQAEQNLVSANAQIGAARAQYFPTISLTGLLGSASTSLSSLWTGPARLWSYAGSASIPIFTAGAIGGSVEAAKARNTQALLQYQAAIQSAFADVDNALIGEQKVAAQLAATDQQIQALGNYASLSRDLYEGGYSSYLEVLDAERSLFNAQLSQSDLQRQRLDQIVNVYKAMGYGWTPTGPTTSSHPP